MIPRAVVGGPADQAMAGPVLGLTKQYIGLEIVINLSNYIAAYASNLLVHSSNFISRSHTINLSSFCCGIHSFTVWLR